LHFKAPEEVVGLVAIFVAAAQRDVAVAVAVVAEWHF
jgi:hypothetical protein